ncbi:MAG: L-fucose:H+ symporter permease [Chitinophagaceae bacterium]|nr:L-fucose:H+ symporter permease [Chitinophagaceae bacterium]
MPTSNRKLLVPFILVTSLFFFWGFVINLDPILLAHLKKSFSLTTLQSSLVDSAVFIGYFLMALPAGLIMKRFGYKIGIITGLCLFAAGSFLFIPAANTQQYVFFLGALFVIACGLTILETAANPYAASLGDPATSTQRLNFAQSFNGLAATLAPIIGAKIILTKGFTDQELNAMDATSKQLALASEASSVKTPFLVLGIIIIVIAVLFALIKLPEIHTEEEAATGSRGIFQVWSHRHLRWAVIAQFFYVGAQVCVTSFFILYATKAANVDSSTAATYLGLGYGLAFMSGRFIGTLLMRFIQPQRLLALYAVLNILLCAVMILGHGMITIYAIIGIGFFNSIMFPTIFSLGIAGLGSEAKFGSSLIIMAIAGGAILPPVMARISDATDNIQNGYIIPLICFVVVLAFGISGYKIKKAEHAA